MAMQRWSGAVLAALLGVGPAGVSAAKPPDLPVEHRHECPEGREAAPFEFPPDAPAASPAGPAEVRVSSTQFGAAADAAPRAAEARHLFRIAERCRQAGDLDKARTCYQEVHLMCPTSTVGRLAIDRLRAVERDAVEQPVDAGAEEQDAPPAAPATGPKPTGEGSYRRLMERTQPLGLVERLY